MGYPGNALIFSFSPAGLYTNCGIQERAEAAVYRSGSHLTNGCLSLKDILTGLFPH
jgi:hypothetical protein